MDFSISINLITGIMLGLEFVTDDENKSRHMVIDLLIFRLMFSAYYDEE